MKTKKRKEKAEEKCLVEVIVFVVFELNIHNIKNEFSLISPNVCFVQDQYNDVNSTTIQIIIICHRYIDLNY